MGRRRYSTWGSLVFSRAISSIFSEMSTPTTRSAPCCAASMQCQPYPQPRSSTRFPSKEGSSPRSVPHSAAPASPFCDREHLTVFFEKTPFHYTCFRTCRPLPSLSAARPVFLCPPVFFSRKPGQSIRFAPVLSGADDEARTRYLDLGKVALYQMSYIRLWCLRAESNHRHGDFQSPALPTELQRQIGDPERARTVDLQRDRLAF